MKKTLYISEMIDVLNEFKESVGDFPVYLQTDSKGSKFGTLAGWAGSFSWTEKRNGLKVLLINAMEKLNFKEFWEEK